MHVGIILAAWTALAVQPPGSDPWINSVFPERAYDFGTVARGSKIRHAFKLVNKTDQDIHIADYRTKCGCTDVQIGARDIPPGTQTVIEAVIDTTKFQNYKASGLTLVIDRPRFVEVDLNLTCFIRGDLVLNPGQADFGPIQRNAGGSVSVALSYAGGMPNWGITESSHKSTSLEAKIQETNRSADGRVAYLLTATLKPTVPPGYFKDVITLRTNDPNIPAIPVTVTANVQTAVSVSPSIIPLGSMKPGQTVKRRVVVRSSQGQAFKLTDVKPSRDELTAAKDEEAKSVHFVELTFRAPAQKGPFHAVVEISTDLKDEPPAKLSTFANVTQ